MWLCITLSLRSELVERKYAVRVRKQFRPVLGEQAKETSTDSTASSKVEYEQHLDGTPTSGAENMSSWCDSALRFPWTEDMAPY